MSSKALKLEGQRFGFVRVLRRVQSETPDKDSRWLVRCDCGVERIMRAPALRNWPPKTHVGCRKWHKPNSSE